MIKRWTDKMGSMIDKWFGVEFVISNEADPVIEIVVRRNKTGRGYTWNMTHAGGPSDVLYMVHELQDELERITR